MNRCVGVCKAIDKTAVLCGKEKKKKNMQACTSVRLSVPVPIPVSPVPKFQN